MDRSKAGARAYSYHRGSLARAVASAFSALDQLTGTLSKASSATVSGQRSDRGWDQAADQACEPGHRSNPTQVVKSIRYLLDDRDRAFLSAERSRERLKKLRYGLLAVAECRKTR